MISFDTDGRAILVNLRCAWVGARSNAFGSFLSPDSKTNARANARDVRRRRRARRSTELHSARVGPDEAREDDTTHEYHIRC